MPIFYVCVVFTVNVVYNKQTRSSSIKRQDFPACAAADGHDGQSASVKKTCFASSLSDKNPWWTVDIGGVYSFKNLRLSWPAYKHECMILFYFLNVCWINARVCHNYVDGYNCFRSRI